MLENLTQSFKAHMYERTTSPLFGAFMISWGFWNYKTILTVFSDWKVDEKIKYIEGTIFQVNTIDHPLWTFLVHSSQLVLFPLLSALVIIIFYPKPAKWIYTFWKAQQIELNNEKLKLEKKALVTQETHQKLKKDFFELKARFDNMVRDKDEEIENLQLSLQDMQKVLEQEKSKESKLFTGENKIEDPDLIIEALRPVDTDIISAIKQNGFQEFDSLKVLLSQIYSSGTDYIHKSLRTLARLDLIHEHNNIFELTELGNKVADIIQDNDLLSEKVVYDESDLNDNESTVLKAMAISGLNITKLSLVNLLEQQSQLNKTRALYAIGELIKNGFVKQSGASVFLTQDGKKYAIDKNWV